MGFVKFQKHCIVDEMSFLQAILLSIIEGITEYLPISSTGHMVLAARALSLPQTEFVKTFEISIQLGAILAVFFLYFRTLKAKISIWRPIIIAFIPTGILGLVLYRAIKTYLLGNSLVTVIALFIGGVILIFFERYWHPKNKTEGTVTLENISVKQAFGIGLVQSLSMIPGVSRAASCIVGGMVLGLNRTTAVEFSFLLAIPTMAAAVGLDLLKSNIAFSGNEVMILVLGFLGAFFSAGVAVRYFIQYVKHHTLAAFGVYRMLLAAIFWAVFLR